MRRGRYGGENRVPLHPQLCQAAGMVFTVLGSLYGPEGPPGADKSGGGTCWNKMFNGGRCFASAVAWCLATCLNGMMLAPRSV